MSELTSYAPGTPSWVDLATPNIDEAVEFYGGLFGWDVPERDNADQTGGYRQALLRGKPVAGVMPLMQDGQPPAWSTYVSVEDADATTAKVRDAGGTVLVEPMDVMDLGRMAVFADPTGAVFGIWQPGTFVGAEIVNEPGGLSWNELNTRDPEAAKAFYGAVFGWDFQVDDMGEMGTYTTLKRGEDMVGGMLNMAERGVPEEVPAHWQLYFAVEDTDATVAQAKQGGGEVMVEPMEVPAGRFAILTDPHRVSFAVIALSQ
ncbi:MAG TPA: VOC family protein [Solirubrobacterales bacterium]|jgi:predicted enzyme related to lactoylglutathione lyase|nr:VOC family protein [Solirubrobacterales bacterium]